MLEYLPPELQEGFDAARKRAARRQSKMRLQLGEAVFPVLRFWQDGFSLDADLSPARMRGLVDLFDGPRHVFQCLIVASEVEAGEVICSFKRMSRVSDRAALDYWRDENAPTGYLPRPV